MSGRITDPAVLLAATRALGGLATRRADPDALRRAARTAETTGRVLTNCQVRDRGHVLEAGVALGWSPQCTPSPEDSRSYPVRQLTPISRLSWACCLGLAWPDRAADPYPGESFTRAAVVDLAGELGASPQWVKAALDHDLRPAGLIIPDGTGLRLGPLAAAMPGPFIDAIRRFHELLPTVASGSARDEDAAADDEELRQWLADPAGEKRPQEQR